MAENASLANDPRQTLLDLDSLPALRPFPQVASRLMAAGNDPASTAKTFASIIQTDAALTIRLLQITNSSLYSFSREIVSVEQDAEVVKQLRRRYPRLLAIHGSATDELTLAEANLLEADNVVAVLSSEFDNLLVAITCNDMGRDISVYARSNDMTIANRLRKASVHEVISPSHIGGCRIAELILA